jgi:hypothetical protein
MRAQTVAHDKNADVATEYIGMRWSKDLLARLDKYLEEYNRQESLELSRGDIVRKIVKAFLDEIEGKTPGKKSGK